MRKADGPAISPSEDDLVPPGLSDLVLETLDLGMFLLDEDYNILSWNGFLERYTNVQRKDIIGRGFFEYFSYLRGTGWPTRYSQVLETGRPFEVHNSPALLLPVVKAHPTGVFHHIRLYPVSGSDREVWGILTVIEDVTESKLLQDRSQAFLEYAGDAIFIMNNDGKFTYVNQKALMETGFGKEEIIGKYFSDIIDPSSLNTVAKAMDELLAGDEVRHLNCTIIDAHSKRMKLEINATPILMPGSKEVSAIQGIARNVTARKRVEEEIRNLKELDDMILATIPSGVAMVDRNLTVHSVNNSFCHMFSVSEAEVIGRNLVDFLPKDLVKGTEADAEAWILEVLDKVRSGRTYEWHGSRIRRGPDERTLDIKVLPIPGGMGRALILVEDMTERDKLEDQRRQRILLEAELEKLKEVDELKSEFISVASHELRTPLTGIWLYLERLSEGKYCEMSEAHMKKISSVMAQVSILAKIVDEMLETSRLEANLEALSVAPVNIKDVVALVISKMSSQSEEKSQKVRMAIPSGLPKVEADAERIERVVTNLLSNAINYSPRGSRIVVEAEKDQAGIIVKVIDEGPGIPDEHKGRIFDRFYVIDKSLTRKVGGVGLGLSIAKGIIENHGGRIWVEDGPDGGSVFKVFIPYEIPHG